MPTIQQIEEERENIVAEKNNESVQQMTNPADVFRSYFLGDLKY